MRRNLIDAQLVGDLRQIFARRQFRCQMVSARLHNFLAPAVGNRHVEDEFIVILGGFLRGADSLLKTLRQKFDLTHGAYLNLVGVQPFDGDQIAHLFLNEVQDAGDLGLFAFEIIERKNPDGENLDSQFVAPVEHVFKFIRPVIVSLNDIRETVLGGVAAVSIENYPDVVREFSSGSLPFPTAVDRCCRILFLRFS